MKGFHSEVAEDPCEDDRVEHAEQCELPHNVGKDDPKRFGNNRKHVPKSVLKKKRKAQKLARRANRK